MIDVNDVEYLNILFEMVTSVTEKEIKLNYIESNLSDALDDSYLVSQRDELKRKKKSIFVLKEHLRNKLIDRNCRKYVVAVYEDTKLIGTYLDNERYKFSFMDKDLIYSKEFIDVNMKDVKFFDEDWVLDLLWR